MSTIKVPFTVGAPSLLLCVCITALMAAVRSPGAELRHDVLFVANGINATVDSLRQATGRARNHIWDDRGANRQDLRYQFFCDRRKLRWDATVVGDVITAGEVVTRIPKSQNAYDGKRFYDAFYPDGESVQYAHVRPPETFRFNRSYTYNSIAFDPRHLYVPKVISNESGVVEGLRALIDKGLTCWVEGDVAHDEQVVLCIGKATDNPVVRLYVHLDDGARIVREEHFRNGEKIGVILREYEISSGSRPPLLTRFAIPGSFKSGVHQEITVTYETVNEEVSAETFTLLGFGLPGDVRIVDTTRNNVTYRLKDLQETEATLDALVEEVASQALPAEIGDRSGNRPTTTQTSASEPPGAKGNESSSPFGRVRPPRSWLWWSGCAVAAVLAVAGVYLWQRRLQR